MHNNTGTRDNLVVRRQVMATLSDTNLKTAKADAKKLFEKMPGVTGFGIADGCIRIYIRDASVKASLPSEINGVPVECIISGDIKPYAATA
jgi:hypothetical protein